MPVEGWNGKYQQQGNGGWAGTVPIASLAAAVRRGYAVAGTDDGHPGSSPGASWAIGHPEKLIDFGYRAVHETREAAVALIAAYYGKAAARNYFSGCSDGGREALMEAQRYPEDFDGILAGAPANYWSHLVATGVWNEQALLKDKARAVPLAKLATIQRAALAECDELDGVKDGLIDDPRVCHFDPGVLTCKDGDTNECLTAAQVEAVRKIYAGPKNPRTGEPIYAGYAPGTEASPGGWNPWIVAQPAERAIGFYFGNSFFGEAVYEQAQWDYHTLDFDKDIAEGDRKAGSVINAVNPDLRSFRAHGGKLIQYHGWGDAAIPAPGSIEYYERVKAFLGSHPDSRNTGGKEIEAFYRLLLVPGMGHCGGGFGPVNFGNGGPGADPDHDIALALERWVEQGIAPDQVIGTGPAPLDPKRQLSRPLCVYPRVARYQGTGDANDAANFSCVAPQ